MCFGWNQDGDASQLKLNGNVIPATVAAKKQLVGVGQQLKCSAAADSGIPG